MICTQAGERLEPKDIRAALDADKTIEIKAGVRGGRVDPMINKLLVKWGKDHYKRWKNNPKSVEGDAFAALDLEDYIRGEVSWSARQSNFAASTFDIHADASSVRWRGGAVSSLLIWPALPASYVRRVDFE